MTLELYQNVVITEDIAEYHLKKGDVATLIDFVTHPQGEEEGCVLEFFNAVGETIAVTVVALSKIKPLEASEILTTRSIKEAI